MKVLHIVAGIDPKSGGPTRSITGLCRGLSQVGVETHLFVASPLHELQNPSGVHFYKGRGGSISWAREDAEVIIRQVKPDIIHLHGLWMMVNHAAILLGAKYDIPIVQAPRGMLDPWALEQKKWKKRLAWWLYQKWDLKKVAAFHATAEMEKVNIQARGFTQAVFIVPNAVDLPAQPILRSSGMKSTNTALFLSRLHPGKGLLDLAQAWATLKKDRDCKAINGWEMRVVGPDSYGHKAEVIARLKQLGIDKDWHFIDEVDDTRKWTEYANADLFVHPSHSENFGISIAEALYAGLPVITTKGTPWSELLGNPDSSKVLKCESSKVEGNESGQLAVGSGELAVDSQRLDNKGKKHFSTLELSNFRTSRSGWWIEIGAKPLVEALREAIALSDEERRIMGENGRRLVERKYTWPAVAEQMKAAYGRGINDSK